MAALLLLSCRAPTQVIVEISTDISCSDQPQTGISVGPLSDLESRPMSTETFKCDQSTGNIGSIVIIPGGKKDSDFAIRVVSGITMSADDCVRTGYVGGCVVARRVLGFVPHETLYMPIRMEASCIGVPCGVTQTCRAGTCVSATITNLDACATSAGCDVTSAVASGGMGGIAGGGANSGTSSGNSTTIVSGGTWGTPTSTGGTMASSDGGSAAGNGGSAAGNGGSAAGNGGSAAGNGGSAGGNGGSAGGNGGSAGGNGGSAGAIGGLGGSTLGGSVGTITPSSGGVVGAGGEASGGSLSGSGGGSATPPGGACDWSTSPPPFSVQVSLGLPDTANAEIDPVLSHDGLNLYFVSYRNGATGNDIYESTRTSVVAKFGAGNLLAQVSSSLNDTHFFVSATGLESFLSSGRSGTLGNSDIFYATRQTASATWSAFSSLANVNSSGGEFDPHLESDGITLWFDATGRTEGPGMQDIFYARRQDLASPFGAPMQANSLNSAANDWNVSLTDDGRVVVFQSDRDASKHVYYALRTDRQAVFGAPAIVTALDPYMSTLSDPFVSPDGCAIYFAAQLSGGAGLADLYVVSAPP